MGIANHVVPPAELQSTATDLAARLAQGADAGAGMTKWLLNRSFESDRQTAFDEEAFAQELVNNTEDAREGMMAFVERRDDRVQGLVTRVTRRRSSSSSSLGGGPSGPQS